MHYLDASFKKTADTAEWAILGDDIEEMSVELNPDTFRRSSAIDFSFGYSLEDGSA